MKDRIDIYNQVVPNHRQKIVQDMKFYAFIHFTVNTFTGKEWGNGKESPNIFNPSNLNTDDWCTAIKASGMKGVILTAKHHDGFCLWQTNTTEHSIKNTPYKNGKGDIMKELENSCKKYDLKLGVYLSPWDRNSELYGTDKYNDFYIAQLNELLTNYGEIFMLWLDGACGSSMDGKPRQQYDFERIYKTALELQPNIAMSGCAPDVRWVGNESGVARESEYNVVPKFQYELQNIATHCQQQDDIKKFQQRCRDVMIQDMGSRKFLADYDDFMWYPSEVDVSIRNGWFFHKRDNYVVKSVEKLMSMYYGAVGGNSLFLLNIPPMPTGEFHKKDISRLKAIGEWIKKEESLKIANVSYLANDSKKGYEIENLLCNKTYSPLNEKELYRIVAKFNKVKIDRVRLEENTDYSQRIEKFKILTSISGIEKVLYEGTIVGFNKICIFKNIETDNIILEVSHSRREFYLKSLEIYQEGAYRPKKIKRKVNFFVRLVNKIFMKTN